MKSAFSRHQIMHQRGRTRGERLKLKEWRWIGRRNEAKESRWESVPLRKNKNKRLYQENLARPWAMITSPSASAEFVIMKHVFAPAVVVCFLDGRICTKLHQAAPLSNTMKSSGVTAAPRCERTFAFKAAPMQQGDINTSFVDLCLRHSLSYRLWIQFTLYCVWCV